jgi:fructose-1,6-bisphosphatase/inositol monophosphatase family enzyme
LLTNLEKVAINNHREAAPIETASGNDTEDAAIYFGIRLILEAGRLVRASRASLETSGVTIKEDGSPATEIEERIESILRDWLPFFDPEAVVVGEETGGVLPVKGTAIAIDPIDGTRAFLADTETYSTSMALIRDGKTVLGLVSNPATGEIAYATATGEARIIRLSMYGEPDESHALQSPYDQSRPTLVNLHPSPKARRVIDHLYQAWESNDIAMVRSPGGSPAWALVEAARGHFAYANLWSMRPAEAFDLAAGTLIVRGAGGDVIDLKGQPIDDLSHSGPFIAGLDRRISLQLTDLLQKAMEIGLEERDS